MRLIVSDIHHAPSNYVGLSAPAHGAPPISGRCHSIGCTLIDRGNLVCATGGIHEFEADSIVGQRARSDGPGPEVMGASTLSGDSVVDRHGENLGEIKGNHGRRPYRASGLCRAVVRRVSRNRRQAVCRDAVVGVDARHRQQFILDVDRDRLKDAPGFDKDHWPSMAQPTWASTVYKFYGVAPYWH